MPRLLLLRHAKSAWDDPGLADFDRPLNPRGRRSAPLMGRHMAEHALLPDRVLCSTSRRTRETFAGLLPFFTHELDVQFSRALYDSSPQEYVDLIRTAGESARTLLVIGHNPTMRTLTLGLTGAGNPALLAEVEAGFPTGGLAVIDFPERNWSGLRPEGGRIVAFFPPRELESVVTQGALP